MEAIPWDRLLVDLISTYKISIEGKDDPLILKYFNMIDTPWLCGKKIVQYNDNQEAIMDNLVAS